MSHVSQKFWLRIFGHGHGGFFKATNRTVHKDGQTCWGKPLVIEKLSKTRAHKLAREYRQAGYVVRIVEAP